MKSNMGPTEELKKEMEAVVNIMLVLEGFDGRKAIEILTGALASIITTTANKGKEEEIIQSVIKELKDGTEDMKNMKPMAFIICPLKKKHSAKPGEKWNMN